MEKASEVSIGVKFVDQNGFLFLGIYDLNAKKSGPKALGLTYNSLQTEECPLPDGSSGLHQ
jgi:hypothetical protein